MLEIMDTAGQVTNFPCKENWLVQEEYGALRDQHMQRGDGFLVVYSIVSKQSFAAADKLARQVVRMRGADVSTLESEENEILS